MYNNAFKNVFLGIVFKGRLFPPFPNNDKFPLST